MGEVKKQRLGAHRCYVGGFASLGVGVKGVRILWTIYSVSASGVQEVGRERGREECTYILTVLSSPALANMHESAGFQATALTQPAL
jgi:hypothetical protein